MATKIWEGPGLDGAPVAVYVAAEKRPSRNSKTKDMIQTLIMHAEIAPHIAADSGADASVCGDCPLRPTEEGGCYVTKARGPLSAWKSGNRKAVEDLKAYVKQLRDAPVRLGAYGDPAVAPVRVWRALTRGRRWTGYTHQWRRCHRAFASLVMASVESSAGRAEARAKGYRTFRVINDVSEIEKGEVLCPASKEAGYRSNCADCLLCSGKRDPADKRKDVAIVVHGVASRQARQVVAAAL